MDGISKTHEQLRSLTAYFALNRKDMEGVKDSEAFILVYNDRCGGFVLVTVEDQSTYSIIRLYQVVSFNKVPLHYVHVPHIENSAVYLREVHYFTNQKSAALLEEHLPLIDCVRSHLADLSAMLSIDDPRAVDLYRLGYTFYEPIFDAE